MSRDPHDALIDQLLREMLGGDRPRDLTQRVMEHAKVYDRTRRRWWVGVGSALAACLAIGISVWALWPQAYPEPKLEDGSLVVGPNGDTLERGQSVATDENSHANIAIGDYVYLALEPQTAMTIGGTKYAEKVFLDKGELDVAVTKKRGTFDVAVGSALVHVTGTKFRLLVKDEESVAGRTKKLQVLVREGSVVVSGIQDKEPVTVSAGSPAGEFPISFEPRKIQKATPVNPPKPAIMPNGRTGDGGQARPAGTRPATRPAPPAALSRALQVMIEPGRVELNGMLARTASDVYVLETDQRRILIFAQQPPFANLPPLGTYVHVVWENTRVTSVAPYVAPAATQAH